MRTQLYNIPNLADLAVIQAWIADPDNRSSLITVGLEPHTKYQLVVVYNLPDDEPSSTRAEAVLGSMIQACEWPE